MRTVHLTPIIGILGAALLLAAVHTTVGLSDAAWTVGLAVASVVNLLLARGLDRAGATAVGPANCITLARATAVAAVAALVADSFLTPSAVVVGAIVALCVPALALDAVDGAVARRTRTVTTVGARFDMEVDAFLILVLSLFVARSVGPWVLVIGAARYSFVLAGTALPWLRRSLPRRYWRKVVAAAAGVVLTFAAADIGPSGVRNALLLVVVVLLAESFGRDAVWLWATRQPVPAGAVLRRIAVLDG